MDFSFGGLPLRWYCEPVSWHLDGGKLSIVAGPRTDMFADPATPGAEPVLTAPRALAAVPDADLLFRVRARVGFTDTFDAGVLLVWADERHWAKLCFERSPSGEPTVVTVVTRGESDDANAWPVPSDTVWLRAARLGQTWAFHTSADGERWQLARYFTLGTGTATASIGLEAQSPVGAGCTVVFDEARLDHTRLADLRDGS